MRLLLIGDDSLARDSLAGLLLHDGYEVVTAESGEIGLVTFCRAAIDGMPFEAVVTDLVLPNLDGTKVIDRILSIAPCTLTVLIAGETGIAGHIVAKPVRIEELRRALGAD
jgi:DNA-binding response OmpR family regulator